MKIKLKEFDLIVDKRGLAVIDKRHKPPMKCGKCKWKEIMEMIQEQCELPNGFSPNPLA
jgi:hypothetical protein